MMADSFPMILEAGAQHFSQIPNIEMLAACRTERALTTALDKAIPDILILDHEVITGNATKYCASLLAKYSRLKVLLFTTMTDVHLLRKFFQIGVNGYLPHTASSDQLGKAVQTIIAGQIFVPDFFKNQLAEMSLGIQSGDYSQLTTREKEVLRLIIDEHTTKEIAEKLYISNSTAETHRLNMIHKLGVRNTAGLVREGLRKGLYI